MINLVSSILNHFIYRMLIVITLLSFSLGSCVPAGTVSLPWTGNLPDSPVLDLNKPTIAIVLGKDQTEITDVMAPYVTFKKALLFNVVLVAEERLPVALSGGLKVIPHFSFSQLDDTLGRDPELIIVPNIPDIRSNEASRLWIQQHGLGKSMVMSICAGAAMLAATGLLDSQTATTHWGDILWIEPSYPKVHWVKGLRYVDTGQYISTAGILSGIDASLHMIERMSSRTVAEQVANELHYSTQYLENPAMMQYDFGFQDALFVLEFMTSWGGVTQGVALVDGVDEMALSALYDVYMPWLARQLLSIAPPEVITTKQGLHLIADRKPADWNTSNEILFPVASEKSQQPSWLEPFDVTSTLFQENNFAFDVTLKHLATYDLPTAEYTAKRLEYRWFVP